jgi:hypothetical protein
MYIAYTPRRGASGVARLIYLRPASLRSHFSLRHVILGLCPKDREDQSAPFSEN